MFRTHRPLAAALFAFSLTALLAAQQVVCLSVDNGPATGTDSLGAPATLAARVEGVQVAIGTAPGMTRFAASAAHEAAFLAAGFTTARTAPNEFCLLTAPGGAPITRGLCYGTTDMGLDLDSDVFPAVPAPAVDAKTKIVGAVVPLPPAQQPPLPFGGVVTIYVWVDFGSVRTRICVQVHLQPSMPGAALRQSIQQQLQAFGFLGHVMTVEDPLLSNQRIDVLQLERTVAGDPINGIEYAYDATSRRIVRNVTGAGLESIFGAYEYGRPSLGLATGTPWSRAEGLVQVNSFFDVFHHVALPLAIGGFALSTGKASLPVFGGHLLVDPFSMVLELGLTDATGTLVRNWAIPGTLALVGFPLHSQGFALSGGTVTLSTAIAAIIAP